LSGEEEPWFLLTKNAFPYVDGRLEVINEQQRLLDYLFADLGVNTQKLDLERLIQQWQRRILIQFPRIPSVRYDGIPNLIGELFRGSIDYTEQTRTFLKRLLGKKAGYYDLLHDESIPFNGDVIIEQPPFIIPSQTRALRDSDYADKVFLFKSPQSSYRISVWERLFPNADIRYIHLTRGFAQTVNSLMDGWQYPAGFFSYDLSLKNTRLNIKGYDNARWWKFDIPPNWRETIGLPLEQVCLNQWFQANDHTLEGTRQRLTIKFEDFLENPDKVLRKITTYVELPPILLDGLPQIMTTSKPEYYRWNKRRDLLLAMKNNPKVIEIMHRLDYPMNPLKWI